MKNTWLVIGVIAIVLGIAGAFAIGAYVFPQRSVASVGGPIGRGWGMMDGFGGMTLAPQANAGVGRGWNTVAPNAAPGVGVTGFRQFGGQQNSLTEIAARDLNLSVSDLIAELQKGKSIADVAKEKGVSTDKIVDDLAAAHTQTLKSAVDAKQLTQAQADAMLALLKANAAQALTQTQTVPAFGLGMMGQNRNGAVPYGMMGGRGWR